MNEAGLNLQQMGRQGKKNWVYDKVIMQAGELAMARRNKAF